MPNSKDFPKPRQGCVYKYIYTQGNAVEDRERMIHFFIEAACLILLEAQLGSYMVSDAYGIIDTGVATTTNPHQ